jgi:hypothetical protein
MITFRTARRLAGLLSLAALSLAIYLGWRGSSRPDFLNQSFATAAAIAVAASAGVAFAFVFFLPDSQELRFLSVMLRWRRLTPRNVHGGICFFAILAAMTANTYIVQAQRTFKRIEFVDDEKDYFRVAKEIEGLPGGVGGLLPALIRGEFAEDNRHPLYPALLAAGSQIVVNDRVLIPKPLMLSETFGTFVFLATTCIAWKLFGPAVAALSACLLAFNGAMIEASSLIACETLLVLFTTLAWYAFAQWNDWRAETTSTARRPEKASPLVGEAASPPQADEAVGGKAASDETPTPHAPLRGDFPHKGGGEKWVVSRTWRSVVVGVLFGLAYLTKASVLFPLFILLALVAFDRSAKPRWLAPTLILIGFLLVSWPLLTRNVVRYGNPLHSFNNKLLFAESYETGIAEPDIGTFGNMKRYLGRHSVKEIVVDRFLGGVVWEGFVLLRSLGPGKWDSGRAILGFIVFLAALIGMGTTLGSRLQPKFLLLWTAFFLLFFGWYQPIASGDRFLLPLVPPLTIAASLGILSLLNREKRSKARQR